MDRLLNYIFLLALVYVFTLWTPANVHNAIILGGIASFLFCSLAFIFRWLTLTGAAAAMIVGVITFGLGGLPMVIALLSFFLSSAVISRDHTNTNNTIVRRSGRQVWANGFWIVIWLIAGIILKWPLCWIAASAALATATADTWATELGSQRFGAKTYLASTWKPVAPGSQGGISWPGLAASLAGSAVIALIAYLGFKINIAGFICILFMGLAGSLIDSYLGATLQGRTCEMKLNQFHWSKKIIVDNNMVNWMATGISSVLILILGLIIL